MNAAPPQLIGPGKLLLVVGPSGGGKDTIIAGAKSTCSDDPTVVFPRRIVTRHASAAEDHDSLDDGAFDRAVGNGIFSFWWQAHGFKYGIPRSIDSDIRAGCTIVCNVSRGVVSDVQARFADVTVVLVTAPANVLATRLSGRARASDGPLAERIQRNDAYLDFRADYTINNTGAANKAVAELLQIIKYSKTQKSALP